jgi:hypothetical protein
MWQVARIHYFLSKEKIERQPAKGGKLSPEN